VKGPLNRLINWAHESLAETVESGQLTVDLTAGNGHDTLLLWRLVGPTGQVIAFDIQKEALLMTRQRLEEFAAPVRTWQQDDFPLARVAGVDLVNAGHQQLQRYLPTAPQGIIANLGYFPGGDRQIITLPETTLQALEQSCQLLAPGGRLAMVVYPGHPGGELEGQLVARFFSALDQERFQVLQLKVLNRAEAPYLMLAEKRF
jgi:16S rRNA C1402 N4-methylase RsmH